MGTDLSYLTEDIKKHFVLENFNTKKIAIDAFNVIYQFLSIIKDRNGNPLKNRDREITSHLVGLLYRNTVMLENNIKPIYCFDGLEKSKKIRWKSKSVHKRVRISETIVNSSKKLFRYMGIPYVQAPSEGEAQCCELIKNDDAWAVASQDYDCLLFGGDRIIRNLAVNQTKKKGNTRIKREIEYITLRKVINKFLIDKKQLIDISILIGNDFFSGIKGFGIKTALNKIKQNIKIENLEIEEIITKGGKVLEEEDFLKKVNKVRKIFLDPLVREEYTLIRSPKLGKLGKFLKENDFSDSRISGVIKRLNKVYSNKKQTNILSFIKK